MTLEGIRFAVFQRGSQAEVIRLGYLTRRQRELLEEFEKSSHKETSPESAGFFSRVKDFFEGKGG